MMVALVEEARAVAAAEEVVVMAKVTPKAAASVGQTVPATGAQAPAPKGVAASARCRSRRSLHSLCRFCIRLTQILHDRRHRSHRCSTLASRCTHWYTSSLAAQEMER